MKICLCFLFLLFPLSLVTSSASAATFVDTSHGSTFTCNSACHVVHGSAGSTLLGGADAELTCLTCHGPAGISVLKAATHNPPAMPAGEKITCLECHNPHANRANYLGGTNTQLIGIQFDYNATPAVEYPLATIREETSSGLGVAKDVVFVTNNDFARVGGDGPCQACHAAGPVSGPTALKNHQWGDCVVCHAHDDNFARRQCVECHDNNASAVVGAPSLSVEAPKVLDKTGGSAVLIGGHLQSVVGEGIIGLTDLQWTVQCIKCHTGHSGDMIIPNNTTVGIDYQKTGGIGLGGSATLVGATFEAEICWDCHAGEGVSEWGVNSDSNGAGTNYDFGSLSQPNWVGATWYSANGQSVADPFWYKRGAIQSTHAVDGSATVPGLDPVANIRCSYCHDVHDLNNLVSDDSSGKPYLRGTWKGNPYLEDGAPQSGMTFGQYEWGSVPRGSILNNEDGGYQIDQNNGNPTNGWTLSDSAGLCMICHILGVDSMNKFDVDEAGTGETPDQSWVGTNGHSNAVIGGTGANKVNIFYTSDRAPGGVDTGGAKPDMGYANHGTAVGYGFRGTDARSFMHLPGMDGGQASKASQPFGGSFYEWGASVDEGFTDPQYHKFSCSKCHNPHASRLPRLMITNCLDTKHNSWDENAGDGGPSIANSNNNGITLGATTAPDSWGRTWSNTTSAQNCHRLAGDNRATPNPGFGSGWNSVTPW